MCYAKDILGKLLVMSFYVPTAELLLPALLFLLHVLTLPPTHPGQARLQLSPDSAYCFALQGLQILCLCLSLVCLVNLSVLNSQESAVGTFVMS